MEERALADRLERDDEVRTVTAFPDGSVDEFYDLSAGGDRLHTRRAFADVVTTGGTDVVELHPTAVEPGGHAVNAAGQVDLLGNVVTLAGHLDDPTFDDLPFEAVSLGEPSSVSVYGFDDGDVLAVENSADVAGWTLDDLDAALGDAVDRFLTADAVCCFNWTSVNALPGALSALAGRDLDGAWFLLDPGSVAGRSGEDVRELLSAVERLGERYDVVLAGNPSEMEAIASAVDDAADDTGGASAGTPDGETTDEDADSLDAAIAALRRASGLAAAVVHGERRASVATSGGIESAENFDVDPVRHTGGGDRFDAGMVHALVRGWNWADALRLGNACASRYVATGESGTVGEIAAFLRDRR